ncbi:MAG: hypothetical protein JWR06_573, partial [Jatrophihabitans sp.]|nr:hypothetical protein [Jatrophihabitans sp.]
MTAVLDKKPPEHGEPGRGSSERITALLRARELSIV